MISGKKLIISKSYTNLVTGKIKNKDNKGCNASSNILLCNRLDFPCGVAHQFSYFSSQLNLFISVLEFSDGLLEDVCIFPDVL